MAPIAKKPLWSKDDSLSLYLKSISKHKSFTADEEAKIAKKIQKGDTDAFNQLIKGNLRFVVSVCRNYQNQGLPLSDLINEGNLGLIRAARHFDGSKNFKFISYAVWWIRQAVLQALAEQSRIVKLPLNRVGVFHKIGKTEARLEQKLARKPNEEEIASELAIDKRDVVETLKIGNSHMSLDSPVKGDSTSGTTYLETLTPQELEMPDDKTMYRSLIKEIELGLSSLTEREKKVIKLYFGIDQETSHTLDEIGVHFNLTRERVRQIKERALKRLKKSSQFEQLRIYAV